MQNLSDYQRKVLLKNPNVEKISDRNIVYTSAFEIKAVQNYLAGCSPDDIFKAANIDAKYFVKQYCHSCIKRWKKKYLDEGKHSLKLSHTGKKATGRPRQTNTDDLSIEELRAIVEIQTEVIDMLKKNRALAKKKKVK